MSLFLQCCKFFVFQQTNGAIVVSADELAVPDDHHESYFPRYLLYKKVPIICFLIYAFKLLLLFFI